MTTHRQVSTFLPGASRVLLGAVMALLLAACDQTPPAQQPGKLNVPASATAAIPPPPPSPRCRSRLLLPEMHATGWLRSPSFDLGLILGVLAMALLLGAAASAAPWLFGWVLVVDLWLLGYPHVASMYTRIAFDRQSVRENRFLLLALPPIVLLATAGATFLGGVMALNTIYYYWQSWHYSRQSYGIARACLRAGGAERDRLSDVVVFAFPLWGIVHRAHQHPDLFYGAALWWPPMPPVAVIATGAVALGSFALWSWRRIQAVRQGSFIGIGHSLFVASHVLITFISYVAIPEITRGWLFINIWHNAQYLAFVWAQNARRFGSGIDLTRPFLSRLSQPASVVRYAAVCLGLGAAFYFALGQATSRIPWQVLPLMLVCHQAVNFHHYLVDAVIWRSRRRVMASPARSSA